MKRYIRSDSYRDTRYNVSWYTQYGDQCGESVLVPADQMYDPYSYIENYMRNTYGDEYGGLADYEPVSGEPGNIWDDGYEPIESSMTEEEQLDQAILDGRPFDLNVFRKYKVDPYRAEGAVQAKDIKAGDFIVVTEDASEVDFNTVLEVFDVRYDDPDNYNFSTTLGDDDKVITFICKDRKGRKLPYNLHFWPNDYVGPIIGHQAKLDPNDFVKSATDTADDDWDWSPYNKGTYRVDGRRIVYTDDPREAIRLWVEMQKEAPLDVAIMCETKAQAIELLKCGTAEYLTQLYEEYPDYSPYKLEYLIEDCKKKLADGCKYFHEDGLGDQIHPFDVG